MGHVRSPQADSDLDDIWYYAASKSGSVEIADRLRVPKKQESALAQREMEKRDDLRLCLGAQVDQKIPA